MSAPPFVQPAPLPPPWTQHTAPTGQIYYFNPHTNESTYVRPVPSFLGQNIPQLQKKKKDKPLVKTQVPGTDWLRVKTTEGRVFYSHKLKKESVWTVPEDIREAVEELERQEKEKAEQLDSGNLAETARTAEEEQKLEVERIKSQVQSELAKRKAEQDTKGAPASKKARIEDEKDEDEDEDEAEEEWQREAAAQLAAEAEEHERAKAEAKKAEAEEKRRIAEEEEEKRKEMEAYASQYSLEEGKALFKTLLREKDINPLHPWDTSLPKFVNDKRYSLLPTVSARKEAFDEYCRERARELRQQNVKKEKVSTPQEDFDNLLASEVKSTRTSWTDFRRTWKKDRRFYGWGRDDREREKRFRDFIKDLSHKKKAAAEKAEADFFALLKEKAVIPEGALWKDVKKDLISDPRYDAVGSSSLREELFNTFVKAKSGSPAQATKTEASAAGGDAVAQQDKEDREERRKRAVREREEKVRAERDRLEASIGRSKLDLNKEEGELAFKSLLTDAIRDPQTSWEAALPQLQTDPRFRDLPLPLNQQLHLFHTHVGHLRSKHLNNLHALFESHAPTLATPFKDLPLASLMNALPVVKLGFSVDDLEHEFSRWQRERNQRARTAFDEMLRENSFVSFWGKLGKIGGEGVDGGVKRDEDDGDEGEGGGGNVDMKSLAKNVTAEEITKVLKVNGSSYSASESTHRNQNDRRYIMFDHVPEQREKWVRDYLSQLSAPELSVHVPSSGAS
ncbi:hypothetical protein VNI00_005568 [Paramarasmius palmivorus]|uniref:Transcription elongation regulator 1 n=1 Tax=Paramarasmius palmivorus TaxID=297713 RepID=A0AAW0DDB9_9AGAR